MRGCKIILNQVCACISRSPLNERFIILTNSQTKSYVVDPMCLLFKVATHIQALSTVCGSVRHSLLVRLLYHCALIHIRHRLVNRPTKLLNDPPRLKLPSFQSHLTSSRGSIKLKERQLASVVTSKGEMKLLIIHKFLREMSGSTLACLGCRGIELFSKEV